MQALSPVRALHPHPLSSRPEVNCWPALGRVLSIYRDVPLSLLSEKHRPRLVCDVLVNSDTLTANYSVKQSQLTKLTSEPRARNPEESNETFDRTIRE